MNITWIPTKDFTAGRGGKPLQYIVMHWGVVTNLGQIDTEVANPNREMSYTYALDKDVIHQYVSEDNTAWHAGVFDINQRSIGICIAAGPSYPYIDADYECTAQLIADIFRRRGRLEIKAHRDFKATECPGNLDFGRIRARVDEILAPVVTPPPPPPTIDPKDVKIAELEKQIETMQNQFKTMQEHIVSSDKMVAGQNKQITELSLQVETQTKQLVDIQGDINSKIVDIGNINKLNADLIAQLNIANNRIKTLEETPTVTQVIEKDRLKEFFDKITNYLKRKAK